MKNKLVQYKGGGYSGCIWEWNYGAFDKDSIFHSISASGSRGCKTAEEMLEFISNGTQGRDYYLYDLLREEEMVEFARTSNEGHVHGVAKFLYAVLRVEVRAECFDCGRECLAQDMRPDGLQGAGGIEMEYTQLLCEDCWGVRNV